MAPTVCSSRSLTPTYPGHPTNTSTKTYGWKAEDQTFVREVSDPYPKESGKDPGRNEKNGILARVMRIILDPYPQVQDAKITSHPRDDVSPTGVAYGRPI